MKIHLILLSLTLGLIVSCSKKESAASTSPSSHELAANDFKSFIATPGTLNIVDFSATWCPPCKTLKPVLNQIANEHSDTVKLGIIDVDQAKSLAAQQGVQGIPDVRFYINGKMVDKFTGAAPKEHIEQIIATLLAKHQAELEQQEAAETPDVTPQTPQSEPSPPPHPDLVQPPATPPLPTTPDPPAAPNTPSTPATQPAPVTPAEPAIRPARGNQLPPGMSKG